MKFKIKWIGIFCLVVMYLLTMCDKNSTESKKDPPAYDLTGNWNIIITVTGGNQLPSGTQFNAQIILEQNEDGEVVGIITMEGGLTAHFSGDVSGNEFSFKIKQDAPCQGTFKGNGMITENGDKISGSYSGTDCNGSMEADFVSTVNYTRIITEQEYGNITDVWEGVIYLQTSYFVEQGDSLIIRPGTRVIVAPNEVDSEGSISIDIDGGVFIARGTSDKIIIIEVESPSSENDWTGLQISYGLADLEYCVIRDSQWGMFIFSFGDPVVHISYCLFYNQISGIINFGPDFEIMNSSFISTWLEGYNRWESDHEDNLSNCHFRGNWTDISISGVSDTTNNVIINVDETNFIDPEDESIEFSEDEVTNSVVAVDQSYGFTDGTVDIQSNRIEVTNSVSLPIANAGCGFESGIVDYSQLAKINHTMTKQEWMQYKKKIAEYNRNAR
ncbi:hypothetical protein JW835_06820 [bacterium]|nr:hypothetical protein [bacterium]